jgi:hypothetical protein
MSSLARIAASRANGPKSRGPVTAEGKLASAANSARSTGPVTPEGKARSSRNSSHNIAFAQTILLPGESRETFIELLQETWDDLKPETEIERSLVNIAVVNHWHGQRLWSLEIIRLTHAAGIEECRVAPEDRDIPDIATAHAYSRLCDKSRVLDALRREEIKSSREYIKALSFIEAGRARRAARARR